MGLQIVQECDHCGDERPLTDTSQQQVQRGGWREVSFISSVSGPITLCPNCQRACAVWVRQGL